MKFKLLMTLLLGIGLMSALPAVGQTKPSGVEREDAVFLEKGDLPFHYHFSWFLVTSSVICEDSDGMLSLEFWLEREFDLKLGTADLAHLCEAKARLDRWQSAQEAPTSLEQAATLQERSAEYLGEEFGAFSVRLENGPNRSHSVAKLVNRISRLSTVRIFFYGGSPETAVLEHAAALDREAERFRHGEQRFRDHKSGIHKKENRE